MIVSPVETAEEIEALRQIFNECREFMTKPIAPISPEQQALWWKELPAKVKRFKAFVYRDPATLEIVAYSLLQWHFDGRTTPLFGIKSSARGKNMAREIIRHYLTEAEGPLYGEELSSHKAIIKMNQEVGWQLLYEKDGVRYLYHPNDKVIYPDYQGMIEYWSNE